MVSVVDSPTHLGISSPLSRRQFVSPLLVRGKIHLPVDTDGGGCQYRGVYRKRGKWRATVKIFRRDATGERYPEMVHIATRCVMPLDAAEALARWYERWLGPDWGHIISTYRRHIWKHAPWRIRQVRQSDRGRVRVGWTLAVWMDGECVRVGKPDRFGNDRESDPVWCGEPRLFTSWDEAREFLPLWLQRHYGSLGYLRMWKHREPVSSPEM